MPYGARTHLAALVLCLALAPRVASGEPAAGGTWTDPPAHAAGADKPAPEPAKPASAPAKPAAALSPTPAAAPKVAKADAPKVAKAAPRPARKAVAAPRERTTRVARHAAPAPRRTRVVAAPPVRVARRPRTVAVVPDAPAPQAALRPYGYGPGYGPGYADERLERLRAAEAAGYLVVRRRTVEFPDGRALNIYRPAEDGEPF